LRHSRESVDFIIAHTCWGPIEPMLARIDGAENLAKHFVRGFDLSPNSVNPWPCNMAIRANRSDSGPVFPMDGLLQLLVNVVPHLVATQNASWFVSANAQLKSPHSTQDIPEHRGRELDRTSSKSVKQ
jgi:hypothetical protein